jgi:hypothetical protein
VFDTVPLRVIEVDPSESFAPPRTMLSPSAITSSPADR